MTVRHEESGGVTTLLIDRPETRNALDLDTVNAIQHALAEIDGPMVLGSTSPGVFSSGADLTLADQDRAVLSDSLYALYQAMRSSPKIVIAAVDGPAVGGGAQLLLGSDIRIAGPRAWIRFLGAGHGLVVGAWSLGRLVGRGRALEMILSMEPVTGEEAMSVGLVDRLAPDPLLAATELAHTLVDVDPRVVAEAKRITLIPAEAEALAAERAVNAGWSGSMGGTRDEG